MIFPRYISYKTYVLVMMTTLATLVIGTAMTNSYLEPLSGDLTRIGFYSENSYGWTGKQFKLASELSETGQSATYYDVVVLGDSFSIHSPSSQTPAGAYWTNALAKETGLRVGVFPIGQGLTNNLAARLDDGKKPPRVIIYQSVERSLKARFGLPGPCPDKVYPVSLNMPAGSPITAAKPENYVRNLEDNLYDFGYLIKYLFAQLTQHAFNDQVVEARLSRDDLFSNHKSNHILFLKEDLLKASWSGTDWFNINCNIRSLQNRIQKRGSTLFVLIVAPDKSSVYAPFISDNVPGDGNSHILISKDLNYLELDKLLISKARKGEKDLYLPNDTHWSSATHLFVARQVAEFIR